MIEIREATIKREILPKVGSRMACMSMVDEGWGLHFRQADEEIEKSYMKETQRSIQDTIRFLRSSG